MAGALPLLLEDRESSSNTMLAIVEQNKKQETNMKLGVDT
jgi:hypothetical protein